MSRPYRECPYCGAHLDPGERCDCQDKETDRTGAEIAGAGEDETNQNETEGIKNDHGNDEQGEGQGS